MAITAREPYERFYILLPQYPKWERLACWLIGLAPLVARNMTTIGFSADDAGNGDGLSKRIVYAVNPGQIGTGLTQAWFDEHYPGATMMGIDAGTPEEFMLKWRGA